MTVLPTSVNLLSLSGMGYVQPTVFAVAILFTQIWRWNLFHAIHEIRGRSIFSGHFKQNHWENRFKRYCMVVEEEGIPFFSSLFFFCTGRLGLLFVLPRSIPISHSDRNKISLSSSDISKALESQITRRWCVSRNRGDMKRSVAKFFVLKIDLVYFDLSALFKIPRPAFSEHIDWTR